MSPLVTVTGVAHHFADYINRVAYRGERFVDHERGRFDLVGQVDDRQDEPF